LLLASCPQAEPGDLLLPAAAPNAEREDWCDCLLESSGVVALVLKNLGVVIDTREGGGKNGGCLSFCSWLIRRLSLLYSNARWPLPRTCRLRV